MKSLPFALALIASIAPVVAQETTPKWDVEIPGPICNGSPPPPAPEPEAIDSDILSSRTKQTEVTEAPEMPDLPPVTGTINVTVQLVADPLLPDPPPQLPDLPPDDPAVDAWLEELRETYRSTTLLFLSATTYDNHRTFLRVYPNGKVDEQVSAWSNIDFNHFSGFSTYRVRDGVDGTFHDVGLLMGIGNLQTTAMQRFAAMAGKGYQAPEIPELPDLATGGPAFVVVEGGVESPAMDTLEQVHDLYRKEGSSMETAYHAREAARAERKACLLAHPPIPRDVTFKFWKRSSPLNNEAQPDGEELPR